MVHGSGRKKRGCGLAGAESGERDQHSRFGRELSRPRGPNLLFQGRGGRALHRHNEVQRFSQLGSRVSSSNQGRTGTHDLRRLTTPTEVPRSTPIVIRPSLSIWIASREIFSSFTRSKSTNLTPEVSSLPFRGSSPGRMPERRWKAGSRFVVGADPDASYSGPATVFSGARPCRSKNVRAAVVQVSQTSLVTPFTPGRLQQP